MSLAELAGEGLVIKIGETELRLKPLRVREIAQVEERMRSKKLRVFLEAAQNGAVTATEKARRINQIAATPIEADELQIGMGQPDMFPFVLSLSLSRDDPEMTEDKVCELFDSLTGEQAKELEAALKGLQGVTDSDPPAADESSGSG